MATSGFLQLLITLVCATSGKDKFISFSESHWINYMNTCTKCSPGKGGNTRFIRCMYFDRIMKFNCHV